MAKRTGRRTIFQVSRGKRPSEKAAYNQLATKPERRREFFGLSDADEQAIESEVGKALDVNLTHEGSRSQ